MLDMERCIMCSRCIRFCEEIAGKPQLTFSERGTHVVLTTFPGEQLDNPYAMNTIDICPVGALTSREFRFKARVWEMSATETVCPGCARGCNMYSWVRNNEILRQTPRFNPEVNNYWMCDHGRLETFKQVNGPAAIKSPMVRNGDHTSDLSWDEAVARVGSELKLFKKSEVAAIGSPFATNEENFIFQKFAVEVLNTRHIDFVRHVVEGDEDDLLIRADKTPNSLGALEAGVRPREGGLDYQGIIAAVKEGRIKALVVMDDNIAADPAVAQILAKLDFLVVTSALENETTKIADVVLPQATFAEKHGTFTNVAGRVQRIRPSVATLEVDRVLEGFATSRLDRFGTQFDRWARGSKRDARPAWRIFSGIAAAMGTRFKCNSVEDAFNELAAANRRFRGMTYQKLGTRGMYLKDGQESPARVGR
jgi:NADH-quinone oxidoreductase subunit G